MSWFKRFFNKDEEPNGILYSQDIPMSTIIRWFLYDTGHEENSIAELLGLSPISEEGIAKEMEDSEERISDVQYLVPFIDAITDISSTALASIAVSMAEQDGEELDNSTEEALLMLSTMYKTVNVAALVGAFSIALSLGLIEPGASVTGPILMEGNNEDE